MLASVRENGERRFEIFGVSPRLLFCVVGVVVFALRFEHAQHAPQAIFEKIVRPPAPCMQFELDLLGLQQIPPAEL